MLVIGSTAAKHTGVNLGRDPGDLDFIMLPQEVKDFQKDRDWDWYKPTSGSKWVLHHRGIHYEVEVAWDGTSALMLHNVYSKSHTKYISPRHQLLMKLSHRYRKNSPHFLKTMNDIIILRDCVKADWNLDWMDWELEILELREKETYTYSHPKLNKPKDEFFADLYTFDHDSIHLAVAVNDRPAFESFSTSEVFCDMDKFDGAHYSTKLHAVYEETCVLALERSVIPHGTDQHKAFLQALEKVCTSITSGRFREFAWENYYNVVQFKKQTKPYITSFYEGIASGVVKPETRT